MDTYDQREAIHAHDREPEAKRPFRLTSRTERMLHEMIVRAEHGRYVLLLVKDRASIMDLTCYLPMSLSRYITVRCIASHKDIDWENWRVPGWEDHELYVEPKVLSDHFPHVTRMLNF